MGTAVSDTFWQAPASKWGARADSITATRAPSSIAASLYNTHALTTLPYIGQLSLPPRQLISQEPHTHSRLLHVPPNTFSRADFFSAVEWGSVRISSMFATLVATLVRAAECTISTWDENFDLLMQSGHRTLGCIRAGGHRQHSGTSRRSLPFCVMLRLDFPDTRYSAKYFLALSRGQGEDSQRRLPPISSSSNDSLWKN